MTEPVEGTDRNGESPVWSWVMLAAMLTGSVVLAYLGYHRVYLARVEASKAGSDVYYAGDRGGLLPECAGGGRYAGFHEEAGGTGGTPVERGTPFQVLRSIPGDAEWFEVRTRSGEKGFVHSMCVFDNVNMACAGPDSAPEADCLRRAGTESLR